MRQLLFRTALLALLASPLPAYASGLGVSLDAATLSSGVRAGVSGALDVSILGSVFDLRLQGVGYLLPDADAGLALLVGPRVRLGPGLDVPYFGAGFGVGGGKPEGRALADACGPDCNPFAGVILAFASAIKFSFYAGYEFALPPSEGMQPQGFVEGYTLNLPGTSSVGLRAGLKLHW